MSNKSTPPRPMGRIETFFIQLATVILGIAITFGGSSLLEKRAERHQVHDVLELVKTELIHNSALLEQDKAYFEAERAHARVLFPYIDNPRAMPDSLLPHALILSNSTTCDMMTTSFEMLKNSPEVRSIKNKQLLYDIIRLYDKLVAYQGSMERLQTRKWEGQKEYFHKRDVQKRNFPYGSPLHFIDAMLHSPNLRLYLDDMTQQPQLTSNLQWNDVLRQAIDKQIADIDHEIE